MRAARRHERGPRLTRGADRPGGRAHRPASVNGKPEIRYYVIGDA
jgi:hypothetical protein